jgi:hypothetical protein
MEQCIQLSKQINDTYEYVQYAITLVFDAKMTY